MNGIRSSANTVSLDGSSLIDVGSNNGVIVTPEQRHGSGSEGPELELRGRVRHRRHERERRDQGRQLEVPRRGLRLHAATSKFAANDRSNSIAGTPKPKSKYQYPGGNVGGPITFGDSYTKNRDRLFFFGAFEVQRQQVDSGSRFNRTFSQAMRNGDFSELLANRGSNLNSIPQLRIPQGFPNAGQPAPNNDMRAVHHAARASTSRASIRCPTTATRTISTTTSTARSSR